MKSAQYEVLRGVDENGDDLVDAKTRQPPPPMSSGAAGPKLLTKSASKNLKPVIHIEGRRISTVRKFTLGLMECCGGNNKGARSLREKSFFKESVCVCTLSFPIVAGEPFAVVGPLALLVLAAAAGVARQCHRHRRILSTVGSASDWIPDW